jgi:hypothetical protein
VDGGCGYAETSSAGKLVIVRYGCVKKTLSAFAISIASIGTT